MNVDISFPKGGICRVCYYTHDCPMSRMLASDKPEDYVMYPDLLDNEVIWCPMYRNDKT